MGWLVEEGAPEGVDGGVGDGGGGDATVGSPGAAVEDAGDGGEEDVASVEVEGVLVEVGEAEEGGGEEERGGAAEAAFEEVLHPAAEEDFLGERDGEEGVDPEGCDEPGMGDAAVEVEESESEAERDGDGRVEEEFAEAGAEVAEAEAESVADAGELADGEESIEAGVEEDELAEDVDAGRPGGLEPAEIDGEAEGDEDEEVQPVGALLGVEAGGDVKDGGDGGRDEQIEDEPGPGEGVGGEADDEVRRGKDGGRGDADGDGEGADPMDAAWADQAEGEDGKDGQSGGDGCGDPEMGRGRGHGIMVAGGGVRGPERAGLIPMARRVRVRMGGKAAGSVLIWILGCVLLLCGLRVGVNLSVESSSKLTANQQADEILLNLPSQSSHMKKVTFDIERKPALVESARHLLIHADRHGDAMWRLRRQKSVLSDAEGVAIPVWSRKLNTALDDCYWSVGLVDYFCRDIQQYSARMSLNLRKRRSPINNFDPLFQGYFLQSNTVASGFRGLARFVGLFRNGQECEQDGPYGRSFRPTKRGSKYMPSWGIPVGLLWIVCGMLLARFSGNSRFVCICGVLAAVEGGILIMMQGYYKPRPEHNYQRRQVFPHNSEIVPQKRLDPAQLMGYSNISEGGRMANNLSKDKQIAVIAALAEGSSIRSIERMTGIHRDTIMRLGVRVGQGCTALMDSTMRDLPCTRLELDEIWGFVGKKESRVRPGDDPQFGNVWTWCAIDAETKLVPAFKVGDRGPKTAMAFIGDVAGRMRNRVQISTDGLKAYVNAIEETFGADVDYGQIVKVYGTEESDHRRYSPPEVISCEKTVISGHPDVDLISTSYVERLNATTRLHMRRLTRLTHAFSKKRENFEAAVGLHFAYYNFVRRHNTLRCTPAMAAGVAKTFWSVGDLVGAAA